MTDTTPQEISKKAGLGIVAARSLLELAGEDLNREGLARTPERFEKAFSKLFSGYDKTTAEVVGAGIFRSESASPIAVNSIDFYSMCEHHILPFWGTVDVVYIPRHKILGLSKIPRIVEMFSRRLQVQERLNQNILDAIKGVIDPKFVAVRMKAGHMCMKMRGVEKQHSFATSEAIWGSENITELELSRSLELINPD